MKIELMKIVVRGLELLNLKFETRKHLFRRECFVYVTHMKFFS